MTQADLADALSAASGETIAASTVSAWETGDRKITAAYLVLIADVLNVRIDTLADRVEPLSGKRQKLIEWYAYNEWNGDKVALLELMALYMGLPKQNRREIAMQAIIEFEKFAADGGELVGPGCDIEYIERQCRKLYGRRTE